MIKSSLFLSPSPSTLLRTGLLAVLLAACAPTETPTRFPETASATPVNVETTATPIVDLTATRVYTDSLNSATPAPTVQAAATSRGPNLEAIDPTTVSLASGGVQFVEFFRFTWTTCRAMAPVVHGLEAKYFGKIKFTYLDADDPRTLDFQRTLGFVSQPEIYLLDASGNVLKKWVGYTTQEQFEEVFVQYVQ